jgi:hypothetical protein
MNFEVVMAEYVWPSRLGVEHRAGNLALQNKLLLQNPNNWKTDGLIQDKSDRISKRDALLITMIIMIMMNIQIITYQHFKGTELCGS